MTSVFQEAREELENYIIENSERLKEIEAESKEEVRNLRQIVNEAENELSILNTSLKADLDVALKDPQNMEKLCGPSGKKCKEFPVLKDFLNTE